MSMKSKRELLAVVSPRYVLATETDKVRILNEFVAATGYHRKYALTLLNHPPLPRSRPVRRPRAKTYTPAVQQALVRLWEIADRICSKRLVPGLPDLVDALGRHGELTLDASARTLLLSLSPATADRLLAPTRRAALPRGRTTTKPGSLLKHQIPIRTFADWDDARPGFLDIDLVSHGGESASGDGRPLGSMHSLVLTDIATQGTECVALPNRGEQAVGTAIAHARTLLPVPVLGLDSDNGGEFINHHLVRYCQREEITFTRCRPYKKNDQSHVEQKNYSIVRQMIGDDRYEGEVAYAALATVYTTLRLYTNFFQPSVQLVSKQREGGKVTKRYDVAQTPYQRMLAAPAVKEQVKERLREEYLALNPAAVRREIVGTQDALWRLARVRNIGEATNPQE